jgi:putative ABC transport system substrate-binding protein
MRTVSVVSGLIFGLLLGSLAAEAQKPEKVTTIGFLSESFLEPVNTDGFRRDLADRGWVEGQNLRIEHRSADGKNERLPALLADLIRLRVALIVTGFGTPSALAAKKATASIPIVFVTGGDPVAFGIVSNLAKPGGNITGFGGDITAIQKRVELLRAAAPRVKRVAFLANVMNPIHPRLFSATKKAAQQLGLTMHEVAVRDAREFVGAFETMQRERMDALFVPGDAMFTQHRAQLVLQVTKARLPAIYANRVFPDDGGLMSFSVDPPDLFRRAASHVDKILRGARAGDLPVEEAIKFELVLNVRTAKALGLTISPALRLRADHVIE